MFETIVANLLSVLIILAGIVFLAIALVIAYVIFLKKQSETKIPEHIKNIGTEENPLYVDMGQPYKVNVGLAMTAAPKLVRSHINRIFGKDPRAYVAGISLDELKINPNQERVYVISHKGLEMGLRGQDVDKPRQHMYIHKEALSATIS